MYLVILLYFIAASMITASKWGLGFAAPIFFMAARMILAGSLLLGYLVCTSISKSLILSIKHDWFLFAQIVFLHIYLTYLCNLCALQYMVSAESSVFYNLSPLIAVLFSYFWFSEYMTPKKWFGLFLGCVSVVPLLIHTEASSFYAHLWPRALTLIAVSSSAYGWIVVRALVKKGYSTIVVNGIGMFFGGLIALVTSLVIEPWNPTPVLCWVPFMEATALIVLVENLTFFNLYGYLLNYYTASFLSFAGLMTPLMTALLAFLFLGETISIATIVSFTLSCVGLYLFYEEELKQGYVT